MIYSNDDPRALLAMEEERTGNYGYDYSKDGECPICGAYEPEYFYLDDEDNCIGCSSCIHRTGALF